MARILIAEDDPLIGSFMEKGFRRHGFSTLLVGDGEEARRLALTDDFDLIILDIGLPRADGFVVLGALRSEGRTTPVVVVSGRNEINAAKCREAGADDYFRKPFHFRELLERVQALLGTPGSRRAV